MFLFKVQERFLLTEIGVILIPYPDGKKANIGDKIKIITPDKLIIKTSVIGIPLNFPEQVIIEKHLAKGDVPKDSEVWLDDTVNNL